jgi:hypothetical protein
MMRALLVVTLFLPALAMAADDDSSTAPARSTASHEQMDHSTTDNQMQPMPGDSDHQSWNESMDDAGGTAKQNTFMSRMQVRY